MSEARSVRLIETRGDLADARAKMSGRVAVVMTMGALHDGHAALLRAARSAADYLLATIFVNPLQFAPGEDFTRYPRTIDADLAVLGVEGADAVFVPDRDEIYSRGEPRVQVDPGPLGAVLEGAHRPGHFTGVLTVVLKLLNLTRPDASFFGEKDYQQLTLIRAMVDDLDLPVEIVGVPTTRDADGLALSSRNRFLSLSERRSAVALSRALRAGVSAAETGRPADEILAVARDDIARTPGVVTDYLELTDPWLGQAPDRGPARLLVAARVGGTRLIDNMPLELG